MHACCVPDGSRCLLGIVILKGEASSRWRVSGLHVYPQWWIAHMCALRPDGSHGVLGSMMNTVRRTLPPEGERFAVGRVEVGG